jgi:FkbM family methyltransferase
MIISYAQNKEDIYINWLLKGKKEGFYVDIGASDPVHYSATKFFYERGWQGINIEPIKRYVNLLNSERPRDINLMLGVAKEQGILDFREYPDADGLSSFSKEMQTQHSEIKFVDYKVNVLPLIDILEMNLPSDQTIDFMKIDVEGYEYEVISSNDWERFRPKLLIIEANHIIHDWHNLLETFKYRKVFFDGLNEYFMIENSIRKELYQDFAEFVIGPNPIEYSHYIKAQTLLKDARNSSEKALKELEHERLKSAKIIRRLEEQVSNLQASANISWSSRIKLILKKLFFSVKQGIKYYLGIQPSPLRYIDTSDLATSMTSDDPQTVFHLLKRADAENYLKPDKRGTGYIVYKVLKFTYKKVKSALKFILRLFRAVKKRLPI